MSPQSSLIRAASRTLVLAGVVSVAVGLFTLVYPPAVDNTLWDGKVVDPDVTDVDTEAIRAFNEARKGDSRVTLSLVPIGDGLTLARKR